MTAVAVVADAAPSAGLGHLARCSAIAAALDRRGIICARHGLGAPEPLTIDGVEWVPLPALDALPASSVTVLDSYVAAPADVDAIGRRSALVALHDEGPLPAAARVVVAMAGAGARPGVRVLAGLAHAPLRVAYWSLPPRIVRERVDRLLVVTGGGVLGEAGSAFAAIARDALPATTVALVRGPLARFEPPDGVELVEAPTSLVEQLLTADVVISAAGQTALEAAATGAPCLALPLVDNQRANAAALAAAGAARVVESGEDLASILLALADPARRAALAARAQQAVDGQGALRVADAIAGLLT